MSKSNRGLAFTITGLGSALFMLLLSGYTGAPVTGGGTISGTVTLSGEPPALAASATGTASAACGAAEVANEEIVRSGHNLANVVVWIDGIESGRPVEAARHTLDNSGCRFVPHVASATVGDTLVVTSSDATLHNIHAFIGSTTAFNMAIPTRGMRMTRRLTAGVHRFQCDAGHTWMAAHLHVFDHPYHAVTTTSGSFSLADVPPGTYTVRAWHERLGTQTATVTVPASGAATANFSFNAR